MKTLPALALALLLAACGQTGPLRLPETKPAPSTTAEPAVPGNTVEEPAPAPPKNSPAP